MQRTKRLERTLDGLEEQCVRLNASGVRFDSRADYLEAARDWGRASGIAFAGGKIVRAMDSEEKEADDWDALAGTYYRRAADAVMRANHGAFRG